MPHPHDTVGWLKRLGQKRSYPSNASEVEESNIKIERRTLAWSPAHSSDKYFVLPSASRAYEWTGPAFIRNGLVKRNNGQEGGEGWRGE